MLSVTAIHRKSRKESRKGTICMQLRDTEHETFVSLGLTGDKEDMFGRLRPQLENYMRLIYYISNKMQSKGHECSANTVADVFRSKLGKGPFSKYTLHKITETFQIDNELVNFGRGFFEEEKRAVKQLPKPAIFEQPRDKSTILGYGEALYDTFANEQRKSTARNVATTTKKFSTFLNGRDIRLADIDGAIIHGFYKYLVDLSIAPTTVSFYMRTLQIILRNADKDGLITVREEWFANVNTSSLSFPRKKTETQTEFTLEKFNQLASLDLSKKPSVEYIRDLFLFSFYTEGMELRDIVSLKRSNITSDGYLEYSRRDSGKISRVFLGQKARQLIAKYRQENTDYLFPFYDMTRQSINDITYTLRGQLRQFSRLAGIKSFSFGMARTLYQSLLKSVSLPELLLDAQK